MGRSIKKNGDTVSRALPEATQSLAIAKSIAIKTLGKKKNIKVLFDHSILRKMFATCMEGTWKLYDGILGMCVNGYRWFVVMVSCGNVAFPWECKFALPKELASENDETWLQSVQRIYPDIHENFSESSITLVADGAFATTALIDWCVKNRIKIEMRMHKNRRIIYKGNTIKISEIKTLIPKGRRLGCTIQATWHNLLIFITAQRRINKHGDEMIVYQIATYKAKPAVHVQNYKERWPIEKFFRTTKQLLGLQDCASRSFEKQNNHTAAVLLAYSIAQLERIDSKYSCVEDAIKALRSMSFGLMKSRLVALDEILRYA